MQRRSQVPNIPLTQQHDDLSSNFPFKCAKCDKPFSYSRVRDEHELGFKESAEKSDGGESASDDVEEEVDQQEWILWHHNQQGAPE